MIVFVDDAMVVADKPSGLLSVPGRGPDRQDCLIARVRDDYPDVLTVHRLDMSTSGLIVMARSPEAHRTLSLAFAERRVDKAYEAIVTGQPPSSGEVDLPLITDWPNRPRQKIDRDIGKPSLTRFRVLQRYDNDTARVALEPVTGRSHQLRVHMLSIGHPIVGDELYGLPPIGPRLMLHAKALSFPHPVTGEVAVFQSAVPF